MGDMHEVCARAKLPCSTIALVGFLLCLPAGGLAQARDWVVHIPELSVEDLARIDLHDVSVQDWGLVLGDPTLTARDFVAVEGQSYDPADLDYRVWLGWHDATDRESTAPWSVPTTST